MDAKSCCTSIDRIRYRRYPGFLAMDSDDVLSQSINMPALYSTTSHCAVCATTDRDFFFFTCFRFLLFLRFLNPILCNVPYLPVFSVLCYDIFQFVQGVNENGSIDKWDNVTITAIAVEQSIILVQYYMFCSSVRPSMYIYCIPKFQRKKCTWKWREQRRKAIQRERLFKPRRECKVYRVFEKLLSE